MTLTRDDTGPVSPLEIVVAADGMRAVIAVHNPPATDGHLTVEQIHAALERAGVVAGLDHDGISQAVSRSEEGADAVGVVVARGQPPVEAVDARLEWTGDMRRPVFRGAVFARLLPGVEPRQGFTVRGEDLFPTHLAPPKPIVPRENAGCLLDPQSGRLTAQRTGVVRLDGHHLHITPIVRVSDDKMALLADVYSLDFASVPITTARLTELVKDAALLVEPDVASMEACLRQAAEQGVCYDCVVARGTPVRHGEDGRFETAYATGLQGAALRSGKIDYTERGLCHTVTNGEVVGTYQSATRGVAGRDVYGTELPAHDGREFTLALGEGVAYAADGKTVVSQRDGMVVVANDVVAVRDVCLIEGDVAFGTGNIHMDRGSVVIRGSVRKGFVVESGGNILVDGSVEGAVIRAKGNVEVKGGIVMMGQGLIRAGGDIQATFVLQGRLEAGGDITITNEITNSVLQAGGSVRTTSRKGKIQGGSIRCRREIEAYEVGSHLGLVSRLMAGEPPAYDQALRAERSRQLETIAKISAALGHEPAEIILARTPPEKMEIMQRLLQILDTADKELATAEEAIVADEAQVRASLTSRIRVSGAIFAGAEVAVHGRAMVVEQDLKAPCLTYDPENDSVVVGSCS